jgi:hypothetical protein
LISGGFSDFISFFGLYAVRVGGEIALNLRCKSIFCEAKFLNNQIVFEKGVSMEDFRKREGALNVDKIPEIPSK